MVTEPFDGTTLEQVAAGLASLPQEKLLTRWMAQLAGILGYLHEQESPVVYRDLRPGSAFVTHQGGVMLVDFGMARLVESAGKRGTLLKNMADLCYGAPEQFSSVPTDARVDIYGLGATIYGLAAREAPPSGWDRCFSGVELAPLRSKNPGLSEEFAALVERMMAMIRPNGS